MSDAPREIWAFLDGAFVGMFVSGGITEGGTHYIRADMAQAELDAAVLAEREAILALVRKLGFHEDAHTATAEMIEAEIQARAALQETDR